MKTTKKITIVTMALMLAFVFAFSNARAAYAPVTPTSGSKTHTLHLENNATELPTTDTVKYTFSVGTPTVVDGDVLNTPAAIAAAVSGTPTIADLTYSSSDTFTNSALAKSLSVDWTGVTFNYPGVYAFPVTKTNESTLGSGKGLSNNNSSGMYIVANIVDNNGILEVGSIQFYDEFDPSKEINDAKNTKEDIEDTWDTPAVDLEIAKKVTGAKGAKDMYFQFTIQVEYDEAPAAAVTHNLVAGSTSSYATNPAAAAYGQSNLTNPSTINVGTNGIGNATVWLKDGDSVKIVGLPYGASYTVTEANTADDPYEVSTNLVGDTKAGVGTTDIVMLNKATDATNAISDTALTATSTLTFTNNKDGVNPTGIILQFGAPIAGVIIVGILFGVVFMRRRNEEDYEYDE